MKEMLEYDEILGTIHHYQSSALFKQIVVTLDRPKTR